MKRGVERALLPKAAYEIAELAYSGVEFLRLLAAAAILRPDVIYQRANLHMLGAAGVAKLLRIPHYVEVNAFLAQERQKSPGLAWPGLAAWSERLLWRCASLVLPVSHVLARGLEEAGVPGDNISVIANGVDIARFAPRDRAAAKRALDLDDKLVLGFIGYVREWHGLERVVELLASEPKLSNGHLLVIGDGPARAALERRAARLGIADRVYFTGVVRRDDIESMAASFDIALQPEVTAYASPLKILEYMALGHAIVAPDSPNIREILTHEVDGLLFDSQVPASFGEAVVRLASDEILRSRLGAAAAANISGKDRTWRGNARRIAGFAAEAMERKSLPGPRAALS